MTPDDVRATAEQLVQFHLIFSGAGSPSLGFLWALIPALLSCLLLAVRTIPEDRTLRDELTDYKEYAQRVRYRLIPGVW